MPRTIDERLERRAVASAAPTVMSDLAGACAVEIVGPRRTRREESRRWRDRQAEDRNRDHRPEARGRDLVQDPRGSSASVGIEREPMDAALGPPRRSRHRPRAAPAIGISLRPAGTWLPTCALDLNRAVTMPAAAMRSSTRSRALRATSTDRSGRRNSGACGSADQQRGFSKAQAAAAPCRNRTARRQRMPSRLPP